MSSVELNIDENRNEFIINGDTEAIRNNRRAKYFFQDFLKASFLENGQISVPYMEERERDNTLKKIQTVLRKYKIEQTDSAKIKEVLDNYYRELENFELFSAKARGIWHNNLDIAEFQAFKDSVSRYLPARTLYPKQFLAAFHLAFSQNSCNFSVPGAGKTSVVYGAYTYLENLPKDDPKHVNKLLIIGPLSSFGPWEDEYQECFGRKVNSKRLSGGVGKNERENHLLSIEPIEDTPELTLMSYQSVSFNLENLRYFLQREGNKVMVVLDEAHKIKNVDGGVWAESVLGLAKYCNSRVVLTGTPVPNGYEDIYNLYEFIWPDKDVINFNVFQLKDMSENRFDPRIERLINDISPFFIRIKKSDLGLPPIENHEPDYIQMGPVQREIYDFIENQYIGYFEENQNVLAATAELTKARFIRLMQAATNPDLLRQPLEYFFAEQGIRDNLYIDDSEVINKILRYKELEPVPKKFELIKKKVQELIQNNEKVILWGTFIRNIKDLQKYLASNDILSEVLIGEVPVERDDLPEEIITREKIIRRFHQEDCPFKVIIANPFAVAESISLHKACHHAIYFERTFNAANFIQSKDRIHRVGLEPGVVTHYHYLLSENSVDETIHRRLIEKETRMLELIESQEIPLISQNMNFDVDLESDIKAIIRDYVRRTTKA
ncbi:helicase-like protein [Flavobacteriaceae bacterium MAR_2010_105]|nr:helicase-like protein [Flavobacteriaceae bacterium MAR_2010_105]